MRAAGRRDREDEAAPPTSEQSSGDVAGVAYRDNLAVDRPENFVAEGSDSRHYVVDSAGENSVAALPRESASTEDEARTLTTREAMDHHAEAVQRARRSAARSLIAVNDRLGEPTPDEIREIAELDDEAPGVADRRRPLHRLARVFGRG